MLQVCVTPGPQKPKDLYSFLEPLHKELNDLCKDGMIVKTDTCDIKLCAHLLFIGGDIPAVAKIAGVGYHTSYHGCRFCTILGVYQGTQMTFPPVSKNDTRPKPVAQLSSTYQKANKRIGQKTKCLFADLPTFHGATFFPIDIMHLLGPGLGKQLWKTIQGKYSKDTSPLYLSNAQQEVIGARIAASRNLTPSSFLGDCGDITVQSGFYRAVDWIHSVLYLVPTIVLEFYDDNTTRNALIAFVTIYRYAFTREVGPEEIACLRNAVKSWTDWLMHHVNDGSIHCGILTINMHYLMHLCKTVERNGPLPYLAAFNMERAIGEIKKRIQSK